MDLAEGLAIRRADDVRQRHAAALGFDQRDDIDLVKDDQPVTPILVSLHPPILIDRLRQTRHNERGE
jgi:hypothetical protein